MAKIFVFTTVVKGFIVSRILPVYLRGMWYTFLISIIDLIVNLFANV